ncbi:MAG: polysaccharide biosynthesis C-terminal domain-containing protein [Selenomonadaceae bacterium]|nr:polysaccharide biosynthesis C-terminal domain-containing protein [Selenomonadaceae bacterium]
MEIFGRKTVIFTRFKSVFVASMFSLMVSYILMLTDNVIAGQIVGDDAVASMTLIFPIFTLIIFVSYVISDGLGMMVSYANGHGDSEEVDRLFSLGMILAVGTSAFFFTALFFLREEILAFWEISPHLQVYAHEYYDGLKYLTLFVFVDVFLYTIFVAKGMENECVKASVASFVTNVALDIILCQKMGVMGVGLGTSLGYFASTIVLGFYLLRSDLHFVWYWDTKKAWKGIVYSTYHSVDTLCLSILPVMLSYTVIKFFGEGDLIIVTVAVNLLTLIMAMYTGIIDCLQPMICQYHAEKNLHSVIKTMRVGISVTIVMNLIMTVLGMIFANLLPTFFGVKEAALVEKAAVAMRFFLPFTTFLGVTLMFTNYYIYIEKLNFGAAIKILLLLILPAVGMLIGAQFTMNIFWLAIGATFAVSFVANRLLTRFYQKSSNLLLIDGKELARQLSYDVDASAEEILALTKKVDADLTRLGVADKTRSKLVLFIEEFGLHAAERAGENIFQLEFSILLGEKDSATLIIRDNGEPYDVIKTAEEGQFSFREFFIEGVTANITSHNYLANGDENRVVLKI